ncbi:hypothetical protein N7467_006905 [Penicillium canescens]|nr:hypothetical protein N7467_006905 [Penicillium canescens]
MTQFDSVLPQAQPAAQAFAQTSVQTPCTAGPVTLLLTLRFFLRAQRLKSAPVALAGALEAGFTVPRRLHV